MDVIFVPPCEQVRQQDPPYELVQGLAGTARAVNLLSMHSMERIGLLLPACSLPQPGLPAHVQEGCDKAKSATIAAMDDLNRDYGKVGCSRLA